MILMLGRKYITRPAPGLERGAESWHFASQPRRTVTDGKMSLLRQAPPDGGPQVSRLPPLRAEALAHRLPDAGGVRGRRRPARTRQLHDAAPSEKIVPPGLRPARGTERPPTMKTST